MSVASKMGEHTAEFWRKNLRGKPFIELVGARPAAWWT